MVRISENTDGNLVIHFLEDNYVVSEKVRDEVHQYVREWLDLDNDLRPFYEMAKKDNLLHNAVDEFYGPRNIGIPDLFEAIVWGILGQQINLACTYTLKRRMVEIFGDIANLTGTVDKPTKEEISKLAVPWRGWESYATVYLWRFLY